MKLTQAGERFRGAEGRLGYLLRQAQHALRTNIDQALAGYGITHPQFAVLSVLEYEPGIHAADLARICMLSAQAVNIIIANLEKAKLLTRQAHKVHGKILVIDLTPLGKKRLEQCKKRVYALEEQMSINLKPAEEKLIRNWLVHCATSLKTK